MNSIINKGCHFFCSVDSFSNWSASTALAHAMKGGKDLKEQLLRVQLATGVGKLELISYLPFFYFDRLSLKFLHNQILANISTNFYSILVRG